MNADQADAMILIARSYAGSEGTDGMKVEPTKAEQKAASTTPLIEHTVSGY
jgi:hypothetical protein